jgi:hypothetical protein
MLEEFVLLIGELTASERQAIMNQYYESYEYDFENEFIKP